MGSRASVRRVHNVPAELTSFVGRRRELAEIKQRLGCSRLVTLTGPGGVGKTRLALRAATDVARAFPDGVWLISLASIHDPLLVSQAAFDALGVRDLSAGWSLTTLADYLAAKHLLVVLDNCEHLLDSCAVFANTLLMACPKLRLMATSRQPLGTAGEVRVPVPPMSLPEEGDDVAVARLRNSEAVWLLCERAASVVPDFAIDATNAAAVLSLCRRLDGIPLALELAAVRLGALSLDQLSQGLASELTILGSGNRGAEARQQTLEATIGWSYGLLEEPERLLWARLSVFAGGFDQEATIAVCSDMRVQPERIVPLLGTLVEKSILKRQLSNGGPPRYSLLETLRQYGRVRLREIDEESRTQKRHFEWICELGRSLGGYDSRQAEMFKRMYLERDNLWAALDYCLKRPGEAAAAAELAANLITYWSCRGPFSDVRRVVTSLVELAPEDSRPRARLLWVAASLATFQNDMDTCAELSRESLRIGTLLNDAEPIASSLLLLALPLVMKGKSVEAVEQAQSAVSLARSTLAQPFDLLATAVASEICLWAGQLDRAIELGEHGLAICRARGELFTRGYFLNYLSQARWQQGERRLAEALAKEGVASKHALDDRNGLQLLLETYAWIAAEGGAHRRAAMLLGYAERVRQLSGIVRIYVEATQQQHERSLAIVVPALGQKTYEAAYENGLAMTVDEGMAFVMEEKIPTQPPLAPSSRSTAGLTRREQEIATLVAQGHTNKQIAAKMVVSERTVESHIWNILNKLGFSSRTQIASWATAQQVAAGTLKR